MIDLDPKSTALVLIDLQNGILGYPLVPTSAQDLLERGKALAEQFRAAGATVALVNVVGSPNSGDLLRQVDEPTPRPMGGLSMRHILPKIAAELAELKAAIAGGKALVICGAGVSRPWQDTLQRGGRG